MKPLALILAVATITGAGTALAFDDEMMGTMANGRMSTRDERDYRVQDPEMDREEMVIDREKRQGRNTVDHDPESDDETTRPHQPFKGQLPN